MDEYKPVLQRAGFRRAFIRIDELLDYLARTFSISKAPPCGVVSPDPSDTVFIDCAVAPGANMLVTGSRRHFPGPVYNPAQVANAAEFLLTAAHRL